MSTPTLGRIVIAAVDPSINNGAEECPAMITRVWSPKLVNVRLLLDSRPSAESEWRTSVELHESKPENPQHAVWWPPRA